MGEDFWFILAGRDDRYGQRALAALHHREYDFKEKVIAWGCSYWATPVRQRLAPG